MSSSLGSRPPIDVMPLSRRRIGLLLFGLLVLLLIVGVRTMWLQSVRNKTLSEYAKGQQQNTQPLPAVRGDILDRNGQELAVGEEAVTFYATPNARSEEGEKEYLLRDPAATAIRIARVLKLTRREEDALVQRLAVRDVGFVYVARQVPRAQAEALQKELAEAHIEGVAWYDEERRLYPNGRVAGQLLGAVDIDNRGIAGLETLYEKSLAGQPGQQVIVRSPNGTPIDVLELQRERDGKNVQLTIDARIQTEVERVLARTVKQFDARGATAIVMNPRTGEVLAMASNPTVDPNHFGSAPGEAQRMRAITDQYEPGSTFKVVTISAALEEGLVTPGMSFLLPPKIQVADRTLEDAHERGTERLTTRDILVQSSNIGTVRIAQRFQGADGKNKWKRFDDWIERFGFGKPTGIDFPGEVMGSKPRLGVPPDQGGWSGSTIANLPIGQGIAVTPIQLAAAYSAIANDGIQIQPHLLQRIGNEPAAKHPGRRVLTARTAQVMRNLFGAVVEDEHGTGKKAQIPGYRVAGKTGTANIAEGGKYVKGRYIASFIGFVPAQNPQLLTLVVVDEPSSPYGGDTAAPAFEQITEFALKYLAIPPDGVI